jgi:hypothetical protein
VAPVSELEEQLCMLKKQKNEHIKEGKDLSQKLQSKNSGEG